MKIFAGGLSTETNTFSPLPTTIEDFHVQHGQDAREGRVDYPDLDLSRTWGTQAAERGFTFDFGVMAWAQPSGITTRTAYETLRQELLDELLAAMPVDVVLLNLHGAMIAEGYDDCEGDIIRRVREIVKAGVVIGVALDLHCHISSAITELADVVVTYKEYPHVDINDRAREVFDLAVRTKLGEIRPKMAVFDCRMVGLFPTSREPLSGFVGLMREVERQPHVLSISFAHGFPFADLPGTSAKILVVSDDDADLADRLARELGLKVYGMRSRIGFENMSLTMDAAFERALSARDGPVVIADQSDNPGGGSPGDATFALRWMISKEIENAAVAMIYDPEVAGIAARAGTGARLTVRLGGKLGPSSGDPLDLEVTVSSVLRNHVHEWRQTSGPPLCFPIGDVAALRCGGIDIVVASRRCQCFGPSIFQDLHLAPETRRLLVVKSAQHFQAEFERIASEIIYMSGLGAVPPDPRQTQYRRLDTAALYPWNDDPLGLEGGE